MPFIPAQAPSFATVAPKLIRELSRKCGGEYSVEVCREHRSIALDHLCNELQALQNLRRNHEHDLSQGEFMKLSATFLSEIRAWRVFFIQCGNSIDKLMEERA